ncbi:10110_t:CDS:1, partial [Ambispora gerdemannii]
NYRNISQPEISSMASQAWKQEPPYVKETYYNFAKRAQEIYLAQNTENHVIVDTNQQNGIIEEINPLISETVDAKETSFNSNFDTNVNFEFTNMQYRIITLENELISMNAKLSHVITLENEISSMRQTISELNDKLREYLPFFDI